MVGWSANFALHSYNICQIGRNPALPPSGQKQPRPFIWFSVSAAFCICAYPKKLFMEKNPIGLNSKRPLKGHFEPLPQKTAFERVLREHENFSPKKCSFCIETQIKEFNWTLICWSENFIQASFSKMPFQNWISTGNGEHGSQNCFLSGQQSPLILPIFLTGPTW